MDAGDMFPDFVLEDGEGETFDSRELAGKRYIIYFYPRDNTPGCTRENVEFNEALPELEAAGISLIGVSKDSVASHKKFADKYALKARLLSDPEHTLLEAAGAWGVKINYGKETTGTIRTTYLVGPDGKVEQAWHNVKVTNHAKKVVDAALKAAQPSE